MKHTIKLPKYKLVWVADYYTYYVHMLGVSESAFWDLDTNTVDQIAMNINAVEKFYSKMRER